MSQPEQSFRFRVEAELTASAIITVEASSQEEAEKKVRAHLNTRGSALTSDLVESASQQIRKEMAESEFDIEIEDTESEPEDPNDE